MIVQRNVASMILMVMTLVCPSLGYGQNYPLKPVRLVTTGLGGGNDIVARLIAQGVAPSMGQPILVDNRSAGIIPVEIVWKAPPDGYAVLVIGSSLWTAPLLEKTSYDPINDFMPITFIANSPNILVVHPSLPVRSVKELIALAKAKPGQLNYSSGPNGAPTHLASELFKYMAGVNMVRIPYKATAEQMKSLIGGEVQLTFATAAAVMAQIGAGRLRALAITSNEPSAIAPGVPTIAASGLPGYEAGVINAMFVAARTPEAIAKRLNQEVVRFLGTADAKKQLLGAGLDVVANTPDECTAKIKSEMTRLGKVIKDAGIRAE